MSKTSIIKSTWVKHARLGQNDNREIHLTVADLIMPRVRNNVTFFYDYIIGEERLESALAETLTRYPELAGR